MTEPSTSPATRLKPILERIAQTLGTVSPETERFETAALRQLEGLVRAGRESSGALFLQMQLVRGELAELDHQMAVAIAVTGRTELLRVCRREWLLALVDWLEDLDGRAAEVARRLAA